MKIYHTKNGINILNFKKLPKNNNSKFKALIVSNNSKNSWANTIKALNQIKFKKKKIIYPTNKNKLQFSILVRILLKFKFFLDEFKINKKILDEINKDKFDKLILIQPFNVNYSTLRDIKKKIKKIEIIAIFVDPFLHRNYFTLNLLFSLKNYDKIIFRQPYNEKYINLLNNNFKIRCFPGTLSINKNLEKKKYIYDLTFIGTYENERYEYLKYLSEKKIKVTIFGNGWSRIKSNKYLFITNKPIYGKKFYETISQSKINMGFLRNDNKDVYNTKTVEILSAGGFLMSEYSNHIKKIFKNKKELVFFNEDKHDLFRKVKYYLLNDTKRERIKKNGFQKLKDSSLDYSSQLNSIINLKL